MPLVDRVKYEASMKGFNATFMSAFEQRPADYSKISTRIPSSGSSEVYNWVGMPPAFTKWLGDRQMGGLRALGQEVTNEDYANGLEIKMNDLDDDRLGAIGQQIRMLADRAIAHFETLIFNLINNGFTAAAYDGQPFFSATHKDGQEAAQSNTSAAVALSQTTFDAAVAQMMTIKDEQGVPLAIKPTHLVVPPGLRSVARGIVEAEVLATGQSNINKGVVELIVSPFITDTNAWFLLDCSRDLRPFILQERRAVQFTEQGEPQSESMFNRRSLRVGADWRGNAAYGPWQLAFGNQGA